MQTITKWIDKLLANFLIALMAAMVLVVSWQVFTRFVLRDPSSYTEELSRFLIIWIGILGASYALRTRAHLGIDMLTHKLAGVKKQGVAILVYCFIILFALGAMVVGGLRLVELTFTLNQVSAAMGIKMGYIYLVIPVSGLIIIYYSVDSIMETIKQKLV